MFVAVAGVMYEELLCAGAACYLHYLQPGPEPGDVSYCSENIRDPGPRIR